MTEETPDNTIVVQYEIPPVKEQLKAAGVQLAAGVAVAGIFVGLAYGAEKTADWWENRKIRKTHEKNTKNAEK